MSKLRLESFVMMAFVAVMFAYGVFSLSCARKPEATTLGVGSEIEWMHPTGVKLQDGRDEYRTERLVVFRAGESRGQKPAGPAHSIKINGVVYAAAPVE